MGCAQVRSWLWNADNSAKCALTACELLQTSSKLRVRGYSVRFAGPAPRAGKTHTLVFVLIPILFLRFKLQSCFPASCFVMKSWRPAVHTLLLRVMLLSCCHARLPRHAFFSSAARPAFLLSCDEMHNRCAICAIFVKIAQRLCISSSCSLSSCCNSFLLHSLGCRARLCLDFHSSRDLPVAERQLCDTVSPAPVVICFVYSQPIIGCSKSRTSGVGIFRP